MAHRAQTLRSLLFVVNVILALNVRNGSGCKRFGAIFGMRKRERETERGRERASEKKRTIVETLKDFRQ